MPEYATTTISKNGIECVAARMPVAMDEAGERVAMVESGMRQGPLNRPISKNGGHFQRETS
jgi:hypothetical protein